MTEREIADFRVRGFATGLTLTSAEEMAAIRDQLESVTSRPSPLFDTADVDKMRSTRNRHLDSLAVLDLACRPGVLDPVSSILGPDLILWRTDFFIQGRSDPETSWHQDRQFSGPRRLPSMVIADADGKATAPYSEEQMRGPVPMPANVSAWVAITDADRSTGCVMVVEGSNREGVIPVRPARPGEKPIFGKGTVLDYEIQPDRVRHLELTAGQFFLFDRLTLHASVPTQSTGQRIGLSMRYTTPDVIVYPEYDVDGHGFAVAPYRALLVRGQDRFGRNDHVLETAAARRQKLGG